MKNIVKLTLPCISLSIPIAQATLTVFLTQAGATEQCIADFRFALTEAIANCLYHAYPDGDGKIHISMFQSQDQFVVKIKDTGIGIADLEKAKLLLFTTKPYHNGFGFSVMESMVDSLSVKSKPGKGTTVILKRKL